MATMRPWTTYILRLVEQGILDREEIIQRTIPFVPQGHAYRVRERQNERASRARVLDARVRTSSEIHRIGARQVIASTLHNQVRTGYLVREGDRYRIGRTPPPPRGAAHE